LIFDFQVNHPTGTGIALHTGTASAKNLQIVKLNRTALLLPDCCGRGRYKSPNFSSNVRRRGKVYNSVLLRIPCGTTTICSPLLDSCVQSVLGKFSLRGGGKTKVLNNLHSVRMCCTTSTTVHILV